MDNITYTRVGDYLLPNIALIEPPSGTVPPIGRYGKMRRVFMREHQPIQYNTLLLTEQLFSHLREVDVIANERRKRGVSESVIIKEIICD